MPQKYWHYIMSYKYQPHWNTKCLQLQNKCSLNIPNPLVQNSTPTVIFNIQLQVQAMVLWNSLQKQGNGRRPHVCRMWHGNVCICLWMQCLSSIIWVIVEKFGHLIFAPSCLVDTHIHYMVSLTACKATKNTLSWCLQGMYFPFFLILEKKILRHKKETILPFLPILEKNMRLCLETCLTLFGCHSHGPVRGWHLNIGTAQY